MSKVDDLARKLCPDGVEYKTLGDIGTIFGGLTGKSKADFSEGNARFVSYVNVFNNLAVDMEAPDYVKVAPGEKQRQLQRGDILFTGSSETPGEVAMSSVITSTPGVPMYLNSFCIGYRLNEPSLIDPHFAKHLFRGSNVRKQLLKTASGVTRFNVSKARLATVRIPVPPVPVQVEIARVLDALGGSGSTLERELTAELDARRRQYAHFQAQLLGSDVAGARTVRIGDIADVFDGPHATPKKTETGPWYLSISSLANGRFDLGQSAHIGFDQYDAWTRRVTPRVGDTMFSYETRLGQAAYWDRDEPAALGRRMGILRPKQSEVFPKYLTLAYLGPAFQALLRTKTVRGATVDRIPIADMANWPISIPSIPEQRRIVEILDQFDALVNDSSSGLGAEIAARRKQYEYYRDKLLTFQELPA